MFSSGCLQTIAAAVVIGVILHAGNHLACDFPRLVNSSEKDYETYLDGVFGDHRPSYGDLVKGVEGVTGILMVILMAIAFTLATKWFRRNLVKLPKPFNRLTGFNAFWYSHHLFVIVYVLLTIHGVYLYLERRWHLQTVCSIIFQLFRIRSIIIGFSFLVAYWLLDTLISVFRHGCILQFQFYFMREKER